MGQWWTARLGGPVRSSWLYEHRPGAATSTDRGVYATSDSVLLVVASSDPDGAPVKFWYSISSFVAR